MAASRGTKFGWQAPEIGKLYMDVMKASETEMKTFRCVGFGMGKFIMENTETGKISRCGPFDWSEVSE